MTQKIALKVFFDSDVLISGSVSETGASHILIQLVEGRLIHGIISKYIIKECRGVFNRKIPNAASRFESILKKDIFSVINVPQKIFSLQEGQAHPKDVPILAGAIHSMANYLVTFNKKDFYPDNKISISIVTPGELLQIVRNLNE